MNSTKAFRRCYRFKTSFNREIFPVLPPSHPPENLVVPEQDKALQSIFIRGQNTWNGGQPLILVDGVERPMENVDVNEVESISVLKGCFSNSRIRG